MNVLQKNDIEELLITLKGADEVDIIVRKNGQDIHFEADWLRGVLEYFASTTGIVTPVTSNERNK